MGRPSFAIALLDIAARERYTRHCRYTLPSPAAPNPDEPAIEKLNPQFHVITELRPEAARHLYEDAITTMPLAYDEFNSLRIENYVFLTLEDNTLAMSPTHLVGALIDLCAPRSRAQLKYPPMWVDGVEGRVQLVFHSPKIAARFVDDIADVDMEEWRTLTKSREREAGLSRENTIPENA